MEPIALRASSLTLRRRSGPGAAQAASMTWGEIDFDKRVWIIPRERAKNDRALEAWGRYVDNLMTPAAPNIIALSGR
jgi:hypothetical protein